MRSIIFRLLSECGTGFLWAVFILAIVFVHYTMCVDIPEFRYVDF